MLLNRCEAHRVVAGQLDDAPLGADRAADDVAPRVIGERAEHAVEVYEGGPAVGASSSVCSHWMADFAVPQPSPGRPLIAARSILSLTPARPFSSSNCDENSAITTRTLTTVLMTR